MRINFEGLRKDFQEDLANKTPEEQAKYRGALFGLLGMTEGPANPAVEGMDLPTLNITPDMLADKQDLWVVAYLHLDGLKLCVDLGLETHIEAHKANKTYQDWEALDARVAQFKVEGDNLKPMRNNHQGFQKVAAAMLPLLLLALDQPTQEA